MLYMFSDLKPIIMLLTIKGNDVKSSIKGNDVQAHYGSSVFKFLKNGHLFLCHWNGSIKTFFFIFDVLFLLRDITFQSVTQHIWYQYVIPITSIFHLAIPNCYVLSYMMMKTTTLSALMLLVLSSWSYHYQLIYYKNLFLLCNTQPLHLKKIGNDINIETNLSFDSLSNVSTISPKFWNFWRICKSGNDQ